MPGFMRLITTEGVITEKAYASDPPYTDIRNAVGGYIETIPYLDRVIGSDGKEYACVAYCHEEGKLEGRPFNRTATELWDTTLRAHHGLTGALSDALVGNIVILYGDEAFMRSMDS